MALDPGPIPIAELSEPLQRVVAAPPAARMMAARGLAPMGPQDLATVLYQLSHDEDEAVAAAASKTADGLPDRLLQPALATVLDARVIDFYARRVTSKPDLVEKIVLNRGVDDDTFVYLAANCAERELELIAANEQRVLRTPRIIEALYMNKSARMSTVDRLIELAVRNGIRCEGIPQFDAIAEAVAVQGPPVFNGQSFEIDEQFDAARKAEEELQAVIQQRAAEGGEEGLVEQIQAIGESGVQQVEEVVKRQKRIQDLPMSAKIRLATVGNASARAILIRDPNKIISSAAVNSPALSDMEAIAFAQNRSLIPEVLMAIARNKGFLKLYQVKLGLAFNPKCPLAIVLKVIPHLHDSDVKNLAKSKNVPQQVVTVARRLMDTRAKKH